MTDPAQAFKRLSAAEALRALYIDFEGQKDQPPVLLGVLRRGGKGSTPFVDQDVVDEAFAGLSVPECPCATRSRRRCSVPSTVTAGSSPGASTTSRS